ncbi:MAG: hypothetical protein H7Y37_06195 [Anaerolineae bacterium]|nr:hypothetical protein [Gloeobacterales cyanobacterium ES-bin-313]
MTGSSDHYQKRLDQFMRLTADLHISQVKTDAQINQLGINVDRITDAMSDLREKLSKMFPESED